MTKPKPLLTEICIYHVGDLRPGVFNCKVWGVFLCTRIKTCLKATIPGSGLVAPLARSMTRVHRHNFLNKKHTKKKKFQPQENFPISHLRSHAAIFLLDHNAQRHGGSKPIFGSYQTHTGDVFLTWEFILGFFEPIHIFANFIRHCSGHTLR